MILDHVQRWIALIILVALLAAACAIPTRAQSGDEFAALRAQVSQLHSQGKYADAIPLAEQYVALARQQHGEGHTEYASHGSFGSSDEGRPLTKLGFQVCCSIRSGQI